MPNTIYKHLLTNHIIPRFFNQNIEQNAPENNIPSTQANITRLLKSDVY